MVYIMELQTIIWKEERIYIIKEAITGVTTQGKTIEEAIKNIKEAVTLYLEEMPQIKKDFKKAKIKEVLISYLKEMPQIRKDLKKANQVGVMSVEIA